MQAYVVRVQYSLWVGGCSPPKALGSIGQEVPVNTDALAAAFPDLKMIVQDQIADGDRVVHRLLVRVNALLACRDDVTIARSCLTKTMF